MMGLNIETPTLPMAAPLVAPGRRTTLPVAIDGMVWALLAAAVIFAGLALVSVPVAYSQSMSAYAQAGLMILGGYFIAIGAAYVAATGSRLSPPAAVSPA